MLQPEQVQKLLEHGSSVDISGFDFNVQAITTLVQLAVAKGCVLTVGKGYNALVYEQWAEMGGKNVAFRFV